MCIVVASLATAGVSVPARSDDEGSVILYVGNGCFFAQQHLIVEGFERASLNRSDREITSVAGYAGSTRTSPNHTLCYHNAQNISDYGLFGHAEVVSVDVPMRSLVPAFAAFFGSFIQLAEGVWDRKDYYDVGAEYRALVGFPGGLGNVQFAAALRQANLHNMTLKPGLGADPDTFGTNAVLVMDSDDFSFTQAEVCLQFHDDSTAEYPEAYHALRSDLVARGRLVPTGCPPNYICNSMRGAPPAGQLPTLALHV